MKFMVIVKGCSGEKMPSQEFLAAMGKYNEQLKKAGVFVALEGLAKAATGTRVKFTGKKPVVTDGPFAESKELVGGFWLWKCPSKQEAIEWLKRAPFEDADVEIREVLESKDFAENFTRAYRELETVEAR
jgi:hypothetical protein